jgi:ribose 5-phosphate isomerase B
MRIVIGSDHAGFVLKQAVIAHLNSRGLEVVDLGTPVAERCDYPDYAAAVGREVASGGAELGVLVCGTGVGMSMAANKIAGVRAAVVSDTFSAHATRQHNDCNVLCLGERVVGTGLACDLLDAWLGASFEGGRHADRVAKIDALLP